MNIPAPHIGVSPGTQALAARDGGAMPSQPHVRGRGSALSPSEPPVVRVLSPFAPSPRWGPVSDPITQKPQVVL
jgi:hypothetical protein